MKIQQQIKDNITLSCEKKRIKPLVPTEQVLAKSVVSSCTSLHDGNRKRCAPSCELSSLCTFHPIPYGGRTTAPPFGLYFLHGGRASAPPFGLYSLHGGRASAPPFGLYSPHGGRKSAPPFGLYSLHGGRASAPPFGLYSLHGGRTSAPPFGLYSLHGGRASAPPFELYPRHPADAFSYLLYGVLPP